MIDVLVCDRDKQERALIAQDCKNQVAKSSEELLRLEGTAEEGALKKAAAEERQVDLLYYEFQKGQSVDELRLFRRHYSSSLVMLIADPAVSPLEYLRPGVSPDSLLLRPLTAARLETANAEFMDNFFVQLHQEEDESCFVLDTREEKLFIPFSRIYYFEARDKKLFVRVKNQEYAFYDTIEALEKQLPDSFRRCHRSYIVNTSKIVRIQFAESYIELSNQTGVPVSRSYKPLFKEVGQ